MTRHQQLRGAALALLMAAGAAAPAFAQRVIHLVVPFGPGAVQDTIARTFNAELGQILGATVVVENRPGAGGTIAGAATALRCRCCRARAAGATSACSTGRRSCR